MKTTPTRSLFVVILAALYAGAVACHHESEAPPRYYQLKGTVISVDKGHEQVIVDHEAIPGFMEAMTMAYTVKDDAALEKLKAGDRITARVVVPSHGVWLDHIQIVETPAKPAAAPTVEQHIPQAGEEVPDFSFVNQDGQRIHFRRYRGKVVLLTFVYTRCPFPDYCPRMTSYFAEINKTLSANAALKGRTLLLTLSFDPEHDTPQVLKAYAARNVGNEDPGFRRWEFATIPTGELKEVALFFGLSYWTQGGQILHSMSTALVGPDQKLSHWYPGNTWSPSEVLKDMEPLAAQSQGSGKEKL
jgi:protein SCO1/2